MRYLLTCSLFFLLPAISHAFEPDQVRSIQVTDTTAIYLIDFQLGYQKFAMDIPFVTQQYDEMNSEELTVQYELLQDEEVVAPQGQVRSILIGADVELRDSTYRLKEGEAGRFTLLVVVQTEATLPDSMSINRLPFTLRSDGRVTSNGLTPSELQRYVTPVLDR